MEAGRGNSKVVAAAVLTAIAMAAIGGTAAIAGPSAKHRNTATAKAKARAKAKAKAKAKPGSKLLAPADGTVAPHDEAAEHAAFAAALAAKLGVTAEQVQAALEALRPDPASTTRPDPSRFPAKLAEQLGKSEAEVKAALDALRAEGNVRGPGMRHGPGGHGPDGDGPHGPGSPEALNALAAKLGVTAEQLKAAFDAIRPAAGTRPDPSQLPAKLAEQLGKSEADVKAALDAVRPPGGHHGPGGRFGGPGLRRGAN